MSKSKSSRYVKPFDECRNSFSEKGLEVVCTLKAGSDSTYQARNSETKEVISGGFDSREAVTRYYGE